MAAGILTAAEQPIPTKSLYQAAALGDLEQVNLHIARGTDLNKPDQRGHTALGRAAQGGRTEIVKALVEAGANVNATTPQGPPLYLATIHMHADVAEFLLANDADPNAKDRTERTALIAAAETAQTALVELLVAKGADVNATDKQGQTPLTAAKRGRSDDIAEFLRQKGATEPVNAYGTDPYGRPRFDDGSNSTSLDERSGRDYRSRGAQPDVLADPNAIRARIAAVPGLATSLQTIDANAATEERAWVQRRSDNRTTLIRAVAKQFADELAFLKTVTPTATAPKTSAAIDELLATRTERYAAIASELRVVRRLAMQEMRQTATAGRGRSSGRGGRGRPSRQAGPEAYGAPMDPSQAGPYGRPRPARPGTPTEPEQAPLDPTTESQLQAWLGANPQDKRTLLAAVHDVDLVELDLLHVTATEENATGTVTAIEGLMLARQARIEHVTAKIAAEEERLQRLAERNGNTLNPTAGRRGRGATPPPPPDQSTPTRRGRRGRY